jgi:hypothetical protein
MRAHFLTFEAMLEEEEVQVPSLPKVTTIVLQIFVITNIICAHFALLLLLINVGSLVGQVYCNHFEPSFLRMLLK